MKNPFKREMKILTARPKNMSFKEYKEKLVIQKQWLKERKKGFLVYKAVEFFTEMHTTKKGEKLPVKLRRVFRPFVGDASKLKAV